MPLFLGLSEQHWVVQQHSFWVRPLPLSLTVAQVLLCVLLAGVRIMQPMDIKFIQSASLSSKRSRSTYNTLGDQRYALASLHSFLPLLPPHTVLDPVSIQGHHFIPSSSLTNSYSLPFISKYCIPLPPSHLGWGGISTRNTKECI